MQKTHKTSVWLLQAVRGSGCKDSNGVRQTKNSNKALHSSISLTSFCQLSVKQLHPAILICSSLLPSFHPAARCFLDCWLQTLGKQLVCLILLLPRKVLDNLSWNIWGFSGYNAWIQILIEIILEEKYCSWLLRVICNIWFRLVLLLNSFFSVTFFFFFLIDWLGTNSEWSQC